MPRRGQNPMRWSSGLAAAAPLTLTTMVHVPELAGYWTESFDVLKLCLESLVATTPPPFELVVLDNGSCAEVRRYLAEAHSAGRIDQLFLSRRNLGKVGAWNLLFAAAGGDLVAYADSDVYFLPGWLEASRAVLEAFPEASTVTAQPIPGDLSQHCGATLAGVAADPDLERREGADLIPPRFVASHRLGLGLTQEQYAQRVQNRREVLVRRGGTAAYVSSSHFQFLVRRGVLGRYFPQPTSMPLGDDWQLDVRLDEEGHWRLSTVDYLVHHMGNRKPDLARELPGLASAAEEPPPGRPAAARLSRRFLESRPVRRVLKEIQRRSWELLYPG